MKSSYSEEADIRGVDHWSVLREKTVVYLSVCCQIKIHFYQRLYTYNAARHSQ